MKPVLVMHPWILFHVRDHKQAALPFCWFNDQGERYKAEFRNDGLIYRAGFKTREEAEEWGLKHLTFDDRWVSD